MTQTTEKVILRNLLTEPEYTKKVLPFIKEEYFTDASERILYKTIKNFIDKYNVPPDRSSLEIEIDNTSVNEDQEKKISQTISEVFADTSIQNMDWLLETTESFCQEKALYNSMMKCIDIMGNKSKAQLRGGIPQILSDALAISFDPYIGHDYFDDFENRFDYYHKTLERVPFDLELFNTITKGGIPKKTLNIILAGTGVGKSLFMCHMAASALSQGRNVLYITLELSQEEVAKRIDANLLNITFDDLMVLSKEMYSKRIEGLKNKTNGKLIVKEYPTASANSLHFKALLNELRLKKSFTPDIIFIDYLNICASSRISPGGAGMYEYVKAIAEELRGLAVENNLPIFSATQTNRTGFMSSDVGLDHTSESFGLPQTADFMFAIINNDDLKKRGELAVKQLKNRYNDPSLNEKFFIGVDRSKMKLYDVEPSGQISSKPNVVPKTQTQSKFSKIKVTP